MSGGEPTPEDALSDWYDDNDTLTGTNADHDAEVTVDPRRGVPASGGDHNHADETRAVERASAQVLDMVEASPGVQGLAVIGVLSAAGWASSDVRAAIAYLDGRGLVSLDDSWALWPQRGVVSS